MTEARNDDALAREYRALFEEFTKIRRTCRESTENLDVELFIAALRRQREELMQAHAGCEIRFRIAFDNGKAAIRYVLA